jgi:hypothetical protein
VVRKNDGLLVGKTRLNLDIESLSAGTDSKAPSVPHKKVEVQKSRNENCKLLHKNQMKVPHVKILPVPTNLGSQTVYQNKNESHDLLQKLKEYQLNVIKLQE